ncbi:hypothetical protein JN757_15135 [Pseudomonas granadensis]|uniref:Transcriptional regulator n=1 Tax=Pseudomonas granadensis TaxID=1421430 RepID=A0ABX7G9N6_9PSED|nr:AVAST type 1 anti-phage system protein Avs1c [Pseudomonas granadensis]QRK81909.1 hypothetical protein JN757_15135 [Pseudomonas granadensis]
MRIEQMKTPDTRAEFERRFNLLRDSIEQGKYSLPPDYVDGLMAVRRLPNGRLDILSINQSVRMQMNMMVQFADVMGDVLPDDQDE